MRKLGKARYGLAALASLAVGPAFAAEPLHGWKFDSGVTLRETWTDNVGVTATNAKSDFITEIAPFISARKRGADLKVDFRYSMQNLFYLSDSERNAIRHQLAATANAELYDKHLYLDVNASASQQATNPLGATSTSNINDTGNVTDVYSLSVSPYWQQRFGTYANLLARYSRSQVTSSGNAYSNSGTDLFNLALNSGSAFTQFFWGFNFSDSSVDYDGRPDTSLSTYSATLGYSLTKHLRLSFTQGYEENSYQSVSANAPKGGYWRASVTWVPSQRSKLELGYGDHYYGSSWFGKFSRRGKHLTWDFSYDQSITSHANSFAVDSTLKNQIIEDDEVKAVGDITKQGNVISNSVYLNRALRGGLAYKKGRVDAAINLAHSRRTGLEATYDGATSTLTGCVQIKSTGAISCGVFPLSLDSSDSAVNQVNTNSIDISAGYKFNTQLKGTARLGVSRNTYPELSRQDNIRSIELGLSRTFARSMTGNLTVRHQERDSSQANADTAENAVSASVTIPF